MLSYDGTSFNLNVYDLKQTEVDNTICECEENDDDQVRSIENEQNSSFIGSFFKKITQVCIIILPLLENFFRKNSICFHEIETVSFGTPH